MPWDNRTGSVRRIELWAGALCRFALSDSPLVRSVPAMMAAIRWTSAAGLASETARRRSERRARSEEPIGMELPRQLPGGHSGVYASTDPVALVAPGFPRSGLRPASRLVLHREQHIRTGFAVESDTLWFGAFPSLAADTLAFVPYPIGEVTAMKAEAFPAVDPRRDHPKPGTAPRYHDCVAGGVSGERRCARVARSRAGDYWAS